jgi:putative SOS response-associated peptidase YedK
VRTYCIVTIEAVGEVVEFHDPMPPLLEQPDWPVWLGEVTGDPSALLHALAGGVLMLRPVPVRR